MTDTHDVTAVGRFHVFGLVLSFLFIVTVSVVGAAGDHPGFLVVTAGVAAYLAWDINRTVWRITMTDGLLELRYLHRRRVVQLADVDRVTYIARRARGEGGSSPPMFAVHVADGFTFRIVANDATRALVESLRRRRPGLAVEDGIW